MCAICEKFHAYQPDCVYRDPAQPVGQPLWQAGAPTPDQVQARGAVQAALPVFTLDQIAYQLTDAYWTSQGDVRAGFDASVGDTITVDITALTAAGQQLARWALQAWTAVSGLFFSETSGSAQITFDDEDSGAYSSSSVSGDYLTSSFVNVSKFNWLPYYGATIDSYSFQTYIHETGHALGLGHAGNYNGAARYSETGSGGNHYLNDSWQATVMSYFDQVENTFISASYAYTVTTMAADILAIQSLYGAATANPGDTTYGANSNIGGYLGDLFAQMFGEASADSALYGGAPVTVTLYDTGGVDTLDVSPHGGSQRIDLTPEAASDVLGLTGNLIIARGTVIENAVGGSNGDLILGNGVRNTLSGGGGNDTIAGGTDTDQLFGGDGEDVITGGPDAVFDIIYGEAGSDQIGGGGGDDLLFGGAQADIISGGDGQDIVDGGQGNDTMAGGAGNDSVSGGDGQDVLIGGTGQDVLRGGLGDDSVDGGVGDDVLRGNGGADTLLGGDGNDSILGDTGSDLMVGGGGGDLLIGGVGNDTLLGQTGEDVLNSGGGDDTVTGGSGTDRFVFVGGFDNDTITDFVEGLETVVLGGFTLADVSTSAAGSDLVLQVAGGGDITVVNGITDGFDVGTDVFFA